MLKLQQNQVWKKGAAFIRITRLERHEVAYKTMADLETKEGEHHVLAKKEFCRLLKGAKLQEVAKLEEPSPSEGGS
jgi:hypothetical protein